MKILGIALSGLVLLTVAAFALQLWTALQG